MALLRPLINDLSAGELSPRLSGRVDLPVYYKGCQEITNFRVKALGGVQKRPGTKYLMSSYLGRKARLIPFQIDSQTAIIIEISADSTSGMIRFIDHSSGALVQSGGSAVTIACDYTQDELFEISYAQTDRECYLVHPNHPPVYFRFVSGTPSAMVMDYTTSDQSFGGNLIEYTAPTTTPYEGAELWNAVAQWLTPRKGYDASGTFGGKSVGTIVRGDSTLTITFSDLTTLVIERSSGACTAQGTIRVDLRPFIGTKNYPSAVCFFAGRLWMGGSINDPNTLWGSKPWDYKNFVMFEEIEYKTEVKTESNRQDFTGETKGPDDTYNKWVLGMLPATIDSSVIGKYVSGPFIPYGAQITSISSNDSIFIGMVTLGAGVGSIAISSWKDANVPEYEEKTNTTQQVGAGNAIRITLASEENERILWIAGAQDLYVGTTSTEWVLAGQSNATQAKAQIISRYGSAQIQARFVGGGLLYVNPASRHVRQVGAELPITYQADHMVAAGVKQIDFQQAPDVALYAVLASGELVRCLLAPGAGVTAWDRVQVRSGDTIESIAVVPGTDRDYVYAVVSRDIGMGVRWIEVIQENEDLAAASMWYLDAGIEKSGAAFTAINGLDIFEGEQVTVRCHAPGGAYSTVVRTVSTGAINVPSSDYALVGLPYSAKLKPFRLEGSGTEGLKKGIGRMFFRLFRSFGFTVRYSEDATAPTVPVYLESEPYSGPQEVSTDIPIRTDAEFFIESLDPVPVGIQTIVPDTSLGG
jgi:hypothetical protein